MAKLGDMLHMDENGRFTTSGKGASVSDALKSRERTTETQQDKTQMSETVVQRSHDNEHDQVKLVDNEGRLCGCYEYWQTQDIPEEFWKDGDSITLKSRPTTERRLALLRRSFDNPSLTPKQSTEVTSEIDEILSARLGRQCNRSSRESLTKDSKSEHELLIVRDANGLYLGMYSLSEAQQKWRKSVRHGALINTRSSVPFIQAANSSKKPLPKNTGYSSRVDTSLAEAKEYADSIRRKNPSGYWQQRKAFTYRVLHHSNEPVCEVPYSCLAPAFGDAWILINRREVQLVTTWSAEQVRERAQRAITQARDDYHEISAPGTMCLTEGQFAERERKRTRNERMWQEAAKLFDTGTGKWLTRYVARDAHGLFLGVFTLGEARKLWSTAHMESSVILVPSTVEFADAAASISHTESFETTFSQQRYKTAIEEASVLPEKLAYMDADGFWTLISSARLSVYINNNKAIAHLTPSEIEEAVGNEWFLSSSREAQVITRSGVGVTAKRLRSIEKLACTEPEAAKSASQSSGNQDRARELRRAARMRERTNRAKQTLDAQTQSTPPMSAKSNRGNKEMFYVFKPDGKVIYQCQELRGVKVQAYLEKLLPTYAHIQVPGGMKLTRSLSELGFKSNAQFARACAIAGKGGSPVLDPKIEPDDKASKNRQPAYTGGQVSFDGPEHVLYVFKGTLSCEKHGHKLEAVTGIIATLKGRPVEINVNYCHNCNKFFLSQSEYVHYRDMYGPILGNFSFYESGGSYSGYGFEGLSPQSILNLCGYNVNQNEGLSSEERHLVLANVMDRGICTKPKVMSHLQWLIRSREGNPSMWLACDKWSEDLDWVRRYNINRQRRFVIGSVQRYR